VSYHLRGFVTFIAAAAISVGLISLTGFSASASASPVRASEAAGTAAASTATLAQLLVGTLGIRAGQSVSFDLAGSKITPHRHLHSAVLYFGDGSSLVLKSASGTVRHTYRQAGVYTATFTIVDSAGARSSAKRVVVVGGRTNQVQLKSSTVQLPASDISAVVPLDPSSESFTLARGVEEPKAGQVLLVGRGSLVPDGLIAVVRKVVKSSSGVITVTATDGTLGDAYEKLAAVATGQIGSDLQIIGRSARAVPNVGNRAMVPASAVPFTCSAGGDHPVQVTADFTDTHISATINLSARIFSFDAIVKPVFSVKVQFSGTAKCQLSDGFGLNVPITEIPGLMVKVSPVFTLSATGEIDLNASWDPDFFIGIVQVPVSSDDQKIIQYSASTSAGASGSATATLQGGISVVVSEGTVVGLELDAGPVFTAQASVGSSGACVSVTSDIELEAKLFANVFFIDSTLVLYDGQFFRSTLFSKCAAGSSGSSGSGSESPPQSSGSGGSADSGQPYLGPTVQETTGSTAQTWTDYVHAGGTKGPALSANQTVGVACRTVGFRVADGNTWWYLIGSSPWSASFYVSADAFYNNGQTSGELRGTPFVDDNVPECADMAGANPTPATPPTSVPPGSGKTYAETVGGVTHTWTDYSDAGGAQGPSVPSNATVQVTCKISGFRVADGNTWWYQIASGPWSDAYYASADAFYNNGQTSGSLNGTPFVDSDVPDCTGPTPPPPPPPASTFAETTGSVTHTWADYSDAGGTEGPTIASNQTVQITCRVQGFKVADGDTWWYQIASSPWSDAYYASADAFYNNGATSGSLNGTPFVDPDVPLC
jgi:hypothetical protein